MAAAITTLAEKSFAYPDAVILLLQVKRRIVVWIFNALHGDTSSCVSIGVFCLRKVRFFIFCEFAFNSA